MFPLTLSGEMAKNICHVALIVLLLCHAACGQRATPHMSGSPNSPAPVPSTLLKTDLKALAEATAEALLRKDFNTVADFTYHKVVKLMGGRDETVSAIGQEMTKAERKGITLVSVTVGEPKEVKKFGKQLFSIVPTTLNMKVRDGTMVAQSFMIAVSEDGGKNWTFVDGAIAVDKTTLRELFPYAANKLQLPPKKQPVIYPND